MSVKAEQTMSEVQAAGGYYSNKPIVTTSSITAASAYVAGGFAGGSPIISGAGATATLTAAQSGSTVLFDRAAGIVFTLPAPTVGLWYQFIVSTTITSGAAKIITNTGTVFLAGSIVGSVDNTANKSWVGDGSTHRAVSMNGSTTGGIVGTMLMCECVSSTLWAISGQSVCSSTPVTPFATS